MKHKKKIIGIALLVLAFGSEALTLERIRGAVLIGKPLDVTVQVRMDMGEEPGSLCLEADVFHADTRQEPTRVRVLIEASTQAQTVNARILSSALVDEPIVTVYFRSGCRQKTTRRYVLLADLPSEVAAPLPALLGAPSAPLVERIAPVATPKLAARAQGVNKPLLKPPAQATPKGVMAGAIRKATPSSGRPRLKLDLLELMEEREPTLNFSAELLTPPTDNSQIRSEAAALWLALNASPEETLRQGTRVRALAADVDALKSLTAKNQLGVSDLSARLRKAESERFPAGVVYALIASLLASLLALVFFWNRSRRVGARGEEWWNGATTGQPPANDVTPPGLIPVSAPVRQAPAPSPGLKKTPAAAAGLWKDSAAGSDMDVSMVEVSHSIFDELMQSDAAQWPAPDAPVTHAPVATSAPAGHAPRAYSRDAQAILDHQQRVEFLVSLGRPEEAVELLKKNLHDGDRPNPFLYLYLLGLLHSLGRTSDFEHYRDELGRLFTARVPEFSVFKNEGRNLDGYAKVLSRITELWPTPQVLEVMEGCILQDPFGGKNDSFDLAAFRELLLLQAVAQRIILAPPAASGASASDLLREIKASQRLDLDLSESEMGALAFEPEAIADVDIPLSMSDDGIGYPLKDEGSMRDG